MSENTPVSPNYVDYYVVDANQAVIRVGRCIDSAAALQAMNNTETVHFGIPPIVEELHGPITSYTLPRSKAYPTVGEQLGAIWEVLAANPTLLTAAATDMLKIIQDVKSTYPKDMVYEQAGNTYNPMSTVAEFISKSE